MWTKTFAILSIFMATTGQAEDMTFYITGNGGNCWGCEWAEAQGEITADTPARFAAFADGSGHYGAIAFDSTGGDPVAAMALGRLIRERGWSTDRRELGTPSGADPARDTRCRNACLLAFMGGVGRDIDPNISLTVVGAGASPWISPEVLEYTLEMGISAEVLTIAANVPLGQAYDFDVADHEPLGLDNTKRSTDDWHLEPYKEGLVLATTQRYGPNDGVPFTLFCRVEDPRLHVLVVEPGDHSRSIYPNGPLLDVASGPQFYIKRSEPHRLGPDDIDFIRQDETSLTASLKIPETLVIEGGEDLSFTPNLARVYGPVLNFTIPLPPASWIASVRQNCI